MEKKLEPLLLEAGSFFTRYNFPVDESSRMEMEVYIDPLLPGTVLAIAACLGLRTKWKEKGRKWWTDSRSPKELGKEEKKVRLSGKSHKACVLEHLAPVKPGGA